MMSRRLLLVFGLVVALGVGHIVSAQTEPIDRAQDLEQDTIERNQQQPYEPPEDYEYPPDRDRICENRQKKVSQRLRRIEIILKKRQQLLDNILDRLDEFVQQEDVDASQYDPLRADVVNAKRQAGAVIADFSGAKPRLDCNRGSHTEQVKQPAEAARLASQAVKDYHRVLRKLITAVKQAVDKPGLLRQNP